MKVEIHWKITTSCSWKEPWSFSQAFWFCSILPNCTIPKSILRIYQTSRTCDPSECVWSWKLKWFLIALIYKRTNLALMLRRYEPWLMMSNAGGVGQEEEFFSDDWHTYFKGKCDLQTFARFVFKFNNTKTKSIYYRWAYLVLLTGASDLLKTLKRFKSFIVLKT